MPIACWATQPMIDTHLHYDIDDTKHYDPAQIITILDKHHIQQAVISSTPAELALTLHRHAPERILPFLGVYRSPSDKQDWPLDNGLPDRVRQALNEGAWRGLGELHIFAEQRHSPVFKQLVTIATAHKLPLLMHSDPAVIDSLFEHQPNATVIWAHAGAYPYPALLTDYLKRYPRLHIDLSVRDDRVAPDGQLDDAWSWLLMEHADRFLVGVDTYRTERWRDYGTTTKKIRQWLAQLPTDVAEQIRHVNAERILNTKIRRTKVTDGQPKTSAKK